MKKVIYATVFLIFLFQTITAVAEQSPMSLSSDRRIKVVPYDPDNVVVLLSRYGYQTQVVFSNNETVENVSNGDSLAWQISPVGNNLFIKPLAPSKTDLTVLTNQRSYTFQLDSTQPNTVPTYKLQFVYSNFGFNQDGTSSSLGKLDPTNLNWKYSFTGARALAPVEAFDNGQFTYLRFQDSGMSNMPAVFMVDDNRKELVVNYQIEGDYMVIDGVGKQFTLRNGDEVTSIYNDAAIGDWQSVA